MNVSDDLLAAIAVPAAPVGWSREPGPTATDRFDPVEVDGPRRVPHRAAAALVALDAAAPGAQAFVARLRRASRRAGADPAEDAVLDRLAVAILTARLGAVPAPARGEPWVVEAVKALAVLPGPVAGEFLARIRRERRLLLSYAWPAACRSAAVRRPGVPSRRAEY